MTDDKCGVGTGYVNGFPVRYDKKTNMAYANLPRAIETFVGIGSLNQEMTECLDGLEPHVLQLLHQCRIWHHLTPEERIMTREYVEGLASEDPDYGVGGGYFFDGDGNPDYMHTYGDHKDFWVGLGTSTDEILTGWHYIGMTAATVLCQELDNGRVRSYVGTPMEETVADAWCSAGGGDEYTMCLRETLCVLKSHEIKNRAYAGVEFCFWPEVDRVDRSDGEELDFKLDALPPKLLEISLALMLPCWTEAGPQPQEFLLERFLVDGTRMEWLLESARVKLRVLWLELLVGAAEAVYL